MNPHPPAPILTPEQLRHLRCLKNKDRIDTAPPKECRKLFDFFEKLGLITRTRGNTSHNFWTFTPTGESALA